MPYRRRAISSTSVLFCQIECGNFPEPPLEGLETLIAPSVTSVGDGEHQLTDLSLSRERGGRQQEVVETNSLRVHVGNESGDK